MKAVIPGMTGPKTSKDIGQWQGAKKGEGNKEKIENVRDIGQRLLFLSFVASLMSHVIVGKRNRGREQRKK